MTRERSTWDRTDIAKRAAMPKQADPYTMNQDHVKQQPAADAYVTGTPSSFGEDVHPSGGTWEAEYSGGQVKRNEIGMPEFRGDTFSHPEKTAKEKATQKAGLCVAIARSMLKNASDQDVMKQAVAFMHLPDSEVMATFQRLAAQDEEDDGEESQAQQEQGKQAQDQGQQQQTQDDQGKQAGQVPPQFLEHMKGKDDKKDDKKDDDKDDKKDEQSKQAALLRASQEQMAQMQQQMAQMQQQMAQMQQGQQPMADQQQQVAQQQQMSAQQQQQQQLSQMIEQQMATGKSAVEAATYAAQQCMGQQRQGEDQLIDDMLAEGGGIQAPTQELDIQMLAPEMDMADPTLGPEDEVLQSLFANDQGQGQQQEQQKQAAIRTASSRTVGTRPTAGVTSIGGLPSAGVAGTNRLENIWGSAPNVKEAFGLPTDR